MEKRPFISVVMPVYNVERYLETAIESILGQTFRNLELILVDDCTPDSSGVICDRFAKKDQRVKVIHKEKNQGLGEARNTGMSVATGEWIMYIDSDDWIEKDALEYVVSHIKDSIDVIVWGYSQDFEDDEGNLMDVVESIPETKICIGKEMIGQSVLDLGERTCFNYAWNKLYRRSLLVDKKIIYDSTPLMEDFVFNIKTFPEANGVVSLNRVFSHYRKTPRETLVSKYHEGFFELCKMKVNAELRVLRETGNENFVYIEKAIAMHLKHIMNACIKECSKVSGKNIYEQYNSVGNIINDEHTQKCMSMVKINNTKLKIIQKIVLCKNKLLNYVMFKCLNYVMLNLSGIWRKVRRTT